VISQTRCLISNTVVQSDRIFSRDFCKDEATEPRSLSHYSNWRPQPWKSFWSQFIRIQLKCGLGIDFKMKFKQK